ncbi:MAG: SusC/RagA family TonB-linked outer membrane protein, partial [Muribaculaceae bacterium]
MNRKAWIVMLFALCLAFPALAQKITVQGTVVDGTGEPLIGASVIPQGTTAGAATDFDGKFQLTVDSKATLVVSYVGYDTQNVPVNGQTTLKIVMKENSLVLDEVVAIGYGTVKKNDATGSVNTVKPSEIQAGLATSAQDLLVGQAPGVVVTAAGGPEGGGTIRVRGGSSLNASNDPLIVIDGVPLDNTGVQGMGNALSMIAPDNIENMTILKDASATAIYGSRASNGVIIITTKKGKSGKPQVNFSANFKVESARKTYESLSTDALLNILKGNFGEDSKPVELINNNIAKYGKLSTNWQDEVLRTTFSHDYNLSIGGTVGFLPYRVAVTYTNNNGILINSKMDRATVGFTLTPEFLEGRLKINANAKGYWVKNQFSNNGAVSGAVTMDPSAPIYHNDIMGDGSLKGYTLWNGYYSQMNGAAFNVNGVNNPIAVASDRDDKATVLRSNGNLQIDYALKWLPDLHFNLNLGYDVSKSKENNYLAANSPTAWDSYHNDGAGAYQHIEQFKSNTLLDFYMNYKKEVEAIKSNFDVTAGYSWQRFYRDGWNNGTEFTTNGFTVAKGTKTVKNEITGLDEVVDRITYDNGTYSNIYNIGEGTQRIGTTWTNPATTKWASHLQLLSFFGRLNYTLCGRYLLTATVRGDASSRFSKDNRWGVFPSVALGWKITDEPWMKSVKDVMNEWKLRLGWGITGQQDIGDSYYPYLATYIQSVSGSNYPWGSTSNYISTLYPAGYDPNIKWEETTTWNAGFDFAFLNNRITASVDYYFRKSKDLLSFVTVPVGSATTNMMNQNIGTLENKGIEFSITARPIVTKDFTWTVNYNVAYNKNEITKLNNDGSYIETGGISAGTGGTCQVHAVGYPAFSFFLFEQAYNKDGEPIEGVYVDQNGDGVINDDDRRIRHSKDPKVTMTLGSNFNWKNWDFGFSLRANIGNYVYADAIAGNSNIDNCYKNDKINNLIDAGGAYFTGTKNASVGIQKSDYWLRNASFLRCDNITLGYTWPGLFKNQLRLRVYGAVQNPFVITKYKGLDPENYDGIDRDVYPRSITG